MRAGSATAASRSAGTSSATGSRWPIRSRRASRAARGPPGPLAPGLRALPPQRLPGRSRAPLDAAVRTLVAERLGSAPQGPIRLLTHLRTFGHSFNPVSFYYCFAPDGERLEAIVAEVTNTPWGERHAYVLDAADRARRAASTRPCTSRPSCRWTSATPGAHRRPGRRCRCRSRAAGKMPRLRRDARAAARAADPPIAGAGDGAPPGGDAADARAHLRPRGRAQAQGRARATASAGRFMTARVARRLVMALLKRIRVGQLTVIEDGGETVFGSGAPQATVHVHSPRAWPQLARGSRGMGSSYADGLWDTPDLTAVIRVAARNVGGHRRGPPPADLRARALPARPRRVHAQHAAAQPARTSPRTTTSATSCSS